MEPSKNKKLLLCGPVEKAKNKTALTTTATFVEAIKCFRCESNADISYKKMQLQRSETFQLALETTAR